jgi:hypothetical protein
MKTKINGLLPSLVFFFGVSTSANTAIVLVDYGFNIDGAVLGELLNHAAIGV